MNFTKQEVPMKKMAMVVMMVLLLVLISRPETCEQQQYVNISFTVWKSKAEPTKIAQMIGTPIPRVYRDSWNHDLVSLDVSDRKSHTKILEKDNFRFVLTAEYRDRLTIQVFEKEKELFRFVYNRPSTVDTIFYGSDRMTYMMELTYTADNHPIGLLSPGILKK
jgi:hypothetical protein